MTNEHRKTSRVEHALRASIETPDATIAGELCNASTSGIGLLVPVTIAVGTDIKVTVTLSRATEAGHSLNVTARVASCDSTEDHDGKFRVGAVLGKLSLHDAQAWHDMVQSWRSFVV